MSYRNLYLVRRILSETAANSERVSALGFGYGAWLGTNIGLLGYRLRTPLPSLVDIIRANCTTVWRRL